MCMHDSSLITFTRGKKLVEVQSGQYYCLKMFYIQKHAVRLDTTDFCVAKILFIIWRFVLCVCINATCILLIYLPDHFPKIHV